MLYDQILYIGAQVLSCSYPQQSPGTAWPAAVFRKAKSVGHVFFAVGVGARGSSTSKMWIKGHGLGVLTIVDTMLVYSSNNYGLWYIL